MLPVSSVLQLLLVAAGVFTLAIWVAGWWSIRAGSQAVLGGRRIDLAVAAWFATLAVVHVLVGAAA